VGGRAYYDYLLRTPPAFLGIERPRDPAWQMEVNGLWMAQGGIFEIAEANWNFGLIGCFFVSLLISFFFGTLLRRAVFDGSPFFVCFFIAFGLHGLRSVWYQTFSYYRLLTLFVLVYFIALLISQQFLRVPLRRIIPENFFSI
jgi:hypothetical protein